VPLQELLRQAGWLRALARSLVADPSTAEDVVQETWIAALRHPPSSGAAPRPWLARVARNAASNLRRSVQRQALRERAREPERAANAPEQAAEEAEIQQRLAAAVAALDEPLRTVVVLRYYRGQDSAAIGRQLGIPAGTVRWRLKRALDELRLALDRASGGERERWLSALTPIALARPHDLPPAGAGPLVLAGALLMKKLALVAALVALAALAWRYRPAAGRAADGSPPDGVSAAATVPGAEPLAQPESEAGERVERAAVEARAAQVHGSLLVHVRWSDGSSAAGVGLIVRPADDPLGDRRALALVSDPEGLVRVERIHAGTVRLEGDRGGELEVAVEPGRESAVELVLPPGIDLEGTVSDPSGAPVAGAEILLVAGLDARVGGRDWLATRIVARTDALGGYAVRAAGSAFGVCARAENHVPSYLEPLEEHPPAGGPLRLDFVLREVQLALRGIVLDPQRRPVAGALVAAGDGRGMGYLLEDWVQRSCVGMPVVESAADGTFLARGVLQTGDLEIPVAVMADGFPIRLARVAGDLGATSFGEIVLAAPASIAGVVRGPSGEPVPAARLSVQALDGLAPSDVPFPLPQALADGAGRFTLELVAPGRTPIRIEPPAGLDLGPGFAVAQVEAGQELELQVLLPADGTIRGRARDARGRALADHSIRWTSQTSHRAEPAVTTDAEGRFELAPAMAPPYTLDLVPPGGWKALASLADVAPGPGEVELAVPELGSVGGTFLDEGRRAPPPGTEPSVSTGPLRRAPPSPDGMRIFLTERRTRSAWSPERTGERFLFEGIPPGTYRLTIRDEQAIVLRSDWFLLRPGQHLDLGTIRSERAGSLVLSLPEDAGEWLTAVIRTPELDAASFTEARGSELVAPELSPGTWYVEVDASGMAGLSLPFEIRPGEETRLALELEPGTDRTFVCSFPPDAPWNELRVLVLAGDGRLHLAQSRWRARDGSPSFLVTLPVGTFALEAETDTGLAARGTIVVPSLAPQEEPLAFELR
jgi:RNA polymerase sigma-70 factor (ECF subfamily)